MIVKDNFQKACIFLKKIMAIIYCAGNRTLNIEYITLKLHFHFQSSDSDETEELIEQQVGLLLQYNPPK